MSRDNPLQFAVVREDPATELAVIQRRRSSRLLLIASGGCTALALRSELPSAEITLVDPNPGQLAHVRAKLDALITLDGEARRIAFNVGTDDAQGLSERGNFESLFRVFRSVLHDLVMPRTEWLELFTDAGTLEQKRSEIFVSPYWPVAFDIAFTDSFLIAMFGPDAVQHAEPGSYPRYFQRCFERGLRRPGARDNPFLHHALLGQYLDRRECLPRFLQTPLTSTEFNWVEGYVEDVPELETFDFVHLSNIFDWMEPSASRELSQLLTSRLRPGAVVMWRQLNNERDLEAGFSEHFSFASEEGRELTERDESLFYSSVHVGERD